MSDISSIGSSGASSGASSTTGTTSAQASQFSNPQMFLQLLVAELQNQDPTNPTDPSTIMQQTAELSQVEAVNTMESAITSQQTASQQAEASGLIGRSVTGTVNGTPLTGTVSEIQLDSTGTPTLVVNGTSMPLSAVTDITAATTS